MCVCVCELWGSKLGVTKHFAETLGAFSGLSCLEPLFYWAPSGTNLFPNSFKEGPNFVSVWLMNSVIGYGNLSVLLGSHLVL